MTLLSVIVYLLLCLTPIFLFFFFNDTATTEIYTLSLHDALPISHTCWLLPSPYPRGGGLTRSLEATSTGRNEYELDAATRAVVLERANGGLVAEELRLIR